MQVNVRHDLDDLANDMIAIARRAQEDMRGVVREGIKVGNTLAKDFARDTSGQHARLYPGTFSSRMNRGFSGFGATLIEGEYGPLSRGQGKLAPILEGGSRNNRAHLNLHRSADIIGPAFAGEVRRLPDRWFW